MSDIYKIAAEYLTMCADDVRANDPDATPDEYRDAVLDAYMECIDGCHEVIYTHAAWDLVASDTAGVCEEAADDMGVDMVETLRYRKLSGLMSLLAYCGLYAAGIEQVDDIIGYEPPPTPANRITDVCPDGFMNWSFTQEVGGN